MVTRNGLTAYVAHFDADGKWFLSAPFGQGISRAQMRRTRRTCLEWREVEDAA